MASLTGSSIASSYEQLLALPDGGLNGTTLVAITDGDSSTEVAFKISSNALSMNSTNQLQFGDTGTYIHQSADGVLDLVSDTEIEINATTIDMNGALDLSGNATIGGQVAIGASIGSFKLEVSGGDIGFFKSVSAGSGINNLLTIAATDGGVNMGGGEGVGILFKIPDDETNPSIGANIGAIRESADDSISNTALVFSTSQNDETLDEALRIDSSGNVLIGTTNTYGRFYVQNNVVDQTGLLIKHAPASTSTASVGNISADNSNATATNGVLRVHHEDPPANVKMIQVDTGAGNNVKFSVDEDGDGYYAGSLGIGGVTSPDYPIHVGGGDSAIYLVGTTQGRVILQDSGATSGSQAFDIVSVDDELKFRRLNDARSSVTNNLLILDANSRISLGNNDSSGQTTNTIFGRLAGNAVASGANGNTLIGNEAGNDLTTGVRSVIVGETAGATATTSSNMVLVGAFAGDAITSTDADGTVAVGRDSLTALTSGARNLAIGYRSGTAITTQTDNIAIGYDSLLSLNTTNAARNIAIGSYAMENLNSWATDNIAIGYEAMEGSGNANDIDYNIAIGSYALDDIGNNGVGGCVAIGYDALTDVNNAAAYGTIAIGLQAGANITNGARNTIVGYEGMLDSAGAGDNAVFGYQVLKEGSTAERQTAMGAYALGAVSAAALTGNENTAIGYKALTKLQGSSLENTAVGSLTLENCTTGQQNTTLGYATMAQCVDTNSCVAIGRYAMGAGDVAGDGQVAVGYGALGELTDGTKNTSLGYQAGNLITTGDTNIVIGYDADVDNINRNGCIIIGCELTLNTASDNVVEIGNDTNSMTYDLDGGDITVTSDVRTKMNIEDSKIGLDFINSLRPVTYETKPSAEYPKEFGVKNPVKKKSGKKWDGLIAVEVKQVMDNMGVEFSGWSEGLNTKQTLAYGKLIMPLIKSVQELSAKVEELQSKLK